MYARPVYRKNRAWRRNARRAFILSVAASANQTVSPPVATASASSPIPLIQVQVPTPAATASASAPLPTIQLRVSPAASTASASSPLPTIQLVVPVPAATASASALVPTVTVAALVSPPAATASASSPTPTVQLRVSPTAATASASAPTPTLQLRVSPAASTAAASAPAPVPQVRVSPAVATAVASAPVPTVSAAPVVQPPVATAAASALVPTITGSAAASPPRTRATHSAGPRGVAHVDSFDGSTNLTGATGAVGTSGETGLTIVRHKYRRPARVCALGYSNQVLGGVNVTTVEGQIGRQFHGLRQNQDYTVTGWSTATTEYDAGRTYGYRSIQFDTFPGGWARVAAGDYDATFTTTLNNLQTASAGRWNAQNPFVICLHHEATTSPFNTAGFTAANYRAMWQHLVPIADSLGYTAWTRFGTYNPNGFLVFAYVGWDRMYVGSGGVGPPTAGEGYLDLDPDSGAPGGTTMYRLLGSDIYNNLDSPGVLRYGTDAMTLLTPLVTAAIAKGKDFIIGEMGCPDGATSQDHTNKALWLDTLRVGLIARGQHQPGVCRALLTTIKASSENFNVDSSAESLAAYQRLGASTYFG